MDGYWMCGGRQQKEPDCSVGGTISCFLTIRSQKGTSSLVWDEGLCPCTSGFMFLTCMICPGSSSYFQLLSLYFWDVETS